MKAYKNVDEYIAAAPEHVQDMLHQMRKTIKEVVPPETAEKISYGIPAFTFHGNLVHFGGYDNHIGFYPGPAPIAAFQDELKSYQTAKGTVRFPLDKPLPAKLIQDMTKLAIERNLNKTKH